MNHEVTKSPPGGGRQSYQYKKNKFNYFKLLTLCLCVFVTTQLSFAYALNLDKIKTCFLDGDYKSAITEGEKLIAQDRKGLHSDELYYILGLSYLKDGNYLRASDIFEIIINEFKNSIFADEAKLALGDTYFLRDDFNRAQDHYKDLLRNNPSTKLKAQIYFRLSQTGFKIGNMRQGKEYLEKLNQEFPLSIEARLSKDLCALPNYSSNFFYTVQVGSFSNIRNAKNLLQRLIQKDYPAYIEELSSRGGMSYRVRVGKFDKRQEATNLEQKLIQEGYPTKICP